MSISKNQLKLITSLSQKKYRIKHQLFIAEGVKVVNELLQSSFEIFQLFATDNFSCENYQDKKTLVSEAELKKISQLKTPNEVIGLFKIPLKNNPGPADTAHCMFYRVERKGQC